jgi:glycosyltransferase involved in cell wall biosynthesis
MSTKDVNRVVGAVNNMAAVNYSLIVPVYKNEGSIPRLVQVVSEINAQLKGLLEAVFVVDASPDESFARLREALATQDFSGQLLVHSRNFGALAAVRTGLAAARGRLFAVMAADLQEPPSLPVAMFRALEADECDVVLGARLSRADPWPSRLAASLFWWMYRRLIVKDIPRGGVDVFGCNDPFRLQLLRLEESHSSLVALIFWLGFRRKLIEYHRLSRQEGKSAWTFRRKLGYLADSVFGFTDLPIKLLLSIGVIAVGTSFFLGLAVLVAKLSGWIAVPGYAATMLAVLFFGALNILGIGLVGAYVWRTYENSKQRPLAVVAMKLDFPAKQPEQQSGR